MSKDPGGFHPKENVESFLIRMRLINKRVMELNGSNVIIEVDATLRTDEVKVFVGIVIQPFQSGSRVCK